jgi:hypothetical protein
MEEQEIAAAIGWLLVATGALAMMLSSIFPRFGYRATSAGLLLGCLGLFIAGHTWAAAVVLAVVAAAAAVWGTSALEEQAHDRELFAAYCMGVFGPVQSSLKSPSVPACLTNEPADECSARIADVDRERQRVDLKLRQLQESLATQGVIVPDHYTMLAKYLVATSCWEGF